MATASSATIGLHGLARRLVGDGLIEAEKAVEAQDKAAKQKIRLCWRKWTCTWHFA